MSMHHRTKRNGCILISHLHQYNFLQYLDFTANHPRLEKHSSASFLGKIGHHFSLSGRKLSQVSPPLSFPRPCTSSQRSLWNFMVVLYLEVRYFRWLCCNCCVIRMLTFVLFCLPPTPDPENPLSEVLLSTDFAINDYWGNNFNDMISAMNVMFNLLIVNNVSALWMICPSRESTRTQISNGFVLVLVRAVDHLC